MKRKMYQVFVAAVFILVVGCSMGWADTAQEIQGKEAQEAQETQDFKVYTLGEIYVVGEKESASEEIPLTTVISAEDIEATNSRTVADALSFAAGVDVAMGRKNFPNVKIHGLFDQSRVLILIDGVPYYETYNGPLNLSQISTDNIAKIEIIKGAPSVLYGANAMGGVINIITKKAADKPSLRLTQEAGQVDMARTSVSHGMKKGILNYWFNYSHFQSHGWKLSGDYEPQQGTISIGKTSIPARLENGGTRDNADIKTDSFWLKLGLDPSEGSEYSLNFHYVDTEKGSPFSTNKASVYADRPAFSDFPRLPKYEDWGVDLSGQQKIMNGLFMKGKLFYHHHVDDYLSYSDPACRNLIATSRWKDYLVGGSLITEVQPVGWYTGRLAFNLRGESHQDRDDTYLPFTKYFSYTGSTGLENEFTPVTNLSLVAGFSYDWLNVTDARRNTTAKNGTFTGQVNKDNRDAMTQFNPMIGASYTFSDTTKLFASSARKTRFPTLNQLFGGRAGGNEDLNAEKSINSTLGVSRSFSDFLWGQMAFFHHDITDLISRDYSDSSGRCQNFAKAEMYGLEYNMEIYPVQDLTFKAGYVLNHASDRSPTRATDALVNVPKHKLDFVIQYAIPYIKTRLDLGSTSVSRIYTQLPTPKNPHNDDLSVPGYTVFNVRLTQEFLKHFEAYLAVNNVLDKNYVTTETGFAGLPEPGRNILGGVTANF